MAHSTPSPSDDSGSIWTLLNKLIGIFLVLFAGVAGISLVVGGVFASIKKHSPAPVVEEAPAAPAAAGTAPAVAATAPAAPAPAASGPAQELVLKPDAANPLMYGTKAYTVKAGQPIKLTFDNAAAVPLPHNVVVGKAGSKDALNSAAMKMMTDPEGLTKGYIPADPSVLAHTKLVQPGQKETIEFTLPAPGEYPYMCTFPGHAVLMNGIITAE